MNQSACSAGFARLDITPPLGVQLAGYFEQRLADSLLDPLYVNAVAFRQGDRSALLLVCDLVNIRDETGFTWPGIIASQLGLSPDSVFLSNTHTHTGPLVGDERQDEQYVPWLLRRLCDAGRLALNDCSPITDVCTGEVQTTELTYARRFRAKDGHIQTWAANRETLVGPAAPADESLRLIRILRENVPEIALVNFQTHPDMIGGCGISADYPGALRRRVEYCHENARCVFLQGAEGELVPWNMLEGRSAKGGPQAYRWAMNHGEKIADAALSIWEHTRSTGQSGLAFARGSALVRTKRDPVRTDEAKRVRDLIEAGRGEELTQKWNITPMRAEANVLITLDRKQLDVMQLPVTVLTFCGVALVGIPGELFSQAGKRIRNASPFPATCVCSLTNGRVGYFATAEAYDQGGYEPANSWLVKGVAETLQDTAEKLLSKLYHPNR